MAVPQYKVAKGEDFRTVDSRKKSKRERLQKVVERKRSFERMRYLSKSQRRALVPEGNPNLALRARAEVMAGKPRGGARVGMSPLWDARTRKAVTAN